MAEIILSTMQIKRGLKANLPTLLIGELAYCTDTKEFYVGTAEGNVLINGGGTGGGGEVLTFNTLTDLQKDYPNGTNQPVWITSEKSWYFWDGVVSDTTAPVLTITAGGTFTGTKSVTMSVNETADIYYTLNGTIPTTASPRYTTPLSINSTTTLKAFARDIAGNQSAVQTVTYTLDTTVPSDTTAPNNVTNLTTSNVTQTGLTLSWTASTSTDVASYDVFKGTTLIGNVATTSFNVSGLTASTVYNFVVKAKDAANNSASGTSINVTTTAPATDTTTPVVTVTPEGGTYSSTQTVTLTTDEQATVYYTTDGSMPTTSSTAYNSPITINQDTTLKYFAIDTSGNTSQIQTKEYTINLTTVYTSDLFNRSNNTLLGTTDIAQGGSSKLWENTDIGFGSNGFGIANNVAYPLTNNVVASTVDVGSGDVDISVTLKQYSGDNGIVFRAAGVGQFWRFMYLPDLFALVLEKWTNTNSAIKMGEWSSSSQNSGDVFRIVAKGSDISAYHKGILLGTISDNTFSTATKHGIHAYNGSNSQFDDFVIKSV